MKNSGRTFFHLTHEIPMIYNKSRIMVKERMRVSYPTNM